MTGHGTNWVAYPLLNSLSKGEWNDFVVHVHWSLAAGLRRLAPNLLRRLVHEDPRDRNVPTLQAQDGITRTNYTKIGLYRWTDPVNTNVLYPGRFPTRGVARRTGAR